MRVSIGIRRSVMKTEILLGFPLPLPRVQLQETTFLWRQEENTQTVTPRRTFQSRVAKHFKNKARSGRSRSPSCGTTPALPVPHLLYLQLGVGLQPARQLGGKATVRQQHRVPVLRALPALLRRLPAVGLRGGRARPTACRSKAGAEP